MNVHPSLKPLVQEILLACHMPIEPELVTEDWRNRRIIAAGMLKDQLLIHAMSPFDVEGNVGYHVYNPLDNSVCLTMIEYVTQIALRGEEKEESIENTWYAMRLVIEAHVFAITIKTRDVRDKMLESILREMQASFPLQDRYFAIPEQK